MTWADFHGFDTLSDCIVINPEPRDGAMVRSGEETLPIRIDRPPYFAYLLKRVEEGGRLVRLDVIQNNHGKTANRSLGDLEYLLDLSLMNAGGYERCYRGTVLFGAGKGQRQDWLLCYAK
ncbi:MAG: hypothetical protein EON93_02320 [Burkholderiales bacterium]|nr:MAG: hypothetical protein EON93_02320 [Burkholderiales bacterium]